MGAVGHAEVEDLASAYGDAFDLAPALRAGGGRLDTCYAAHQEAGLRTFLTEYGYKGFTTTFEDLHGLRQLPGLAPQRLMAGGYGFAGEGDWKMAALVRTMKVMAGGVATSFIKEYIYDLDPRHRRVLGSHMLEVCPSIAANKPRVVDCSAAIWGSSALSVQLGGS